MVVTNLDVYYVDFLAVQGVNMEIRPKAVTAIIGPSGCGKSTFLRTLNRMHETTPGAYARGSVQLEGVDLYSDEIDPVEVRRHIGYVFQRPNPFPHLSIYENVLAGIRLNKQKLSKEEANELVISCLKSVNLYKEVKDKLDQLATSLSGGQQQRLCIARAIAVKPNVLLMDEPCSALDPISTRSIEDLIVSLKDQFTIVIVTHNMQQAQRISNWCAFFNVAATGEPGKLVELDKTDVIFNSPSKQATSDYINGRFG
ncbi:MAG: phosphate ABC transporter ATP-binding protein PstB [Candidatus Ancillula trichonymphae]|nr:phosphate ABC transporter ATP-binding protein PstB [Candidatus Ancillula trichonymphae]